MGSMNGLVSSWIEISLNGSLDLSLCYLHASFYAVYRTSIHYRHLRPNEIIWFGMKGSSSALNLFRAHDGLLFTRAGNRIEKNRLNRFSNFFFQPIFFDLKKIPMNQAFWFVSKRINMDSSTNQYTWNKLQSFLRNRSLGNET